MPLHKSLADELATLRAEIARLMAREAALRAAVEAGETTPPRLRPGWPIQRVTPPAPGLTAH